MSDSGSAGAAWSEHGDCSHRESAAPPLAPARLPGELTPTKLLLTSAYPDSLPLRVCKQWALLNRNSGYELTEDPEHADFILFVESSHYTDDPTLSAVRRHPWTRMFKKKSVPI